jgi:uncharacterized membrane protein YphA (DoxX/SURF4 family)
MKTLPLNAAILRVTFGVVWLVDAIFKWLPSFPQNAMDAIGDAASGQPAPIAWILDQFMNLLMQFPHAFPVTIAILESVLALALILGIGRKITYIAGMVLAFAIWFVGEGLGGPYGIGSTDIGASVIYIFVFWGLLLLDRAVGPAYSLDSVIQKRKKQA